MIHLLYDKLDLPPSCHLGKRIYKKLFQENGNLGATDKKTFREDIDTIMWEYTLKPATIPIKPYTDDKQEYVEIAVIQANLNSRNRSERIAEIIHRTIPYPVMLVFSHETSFYLSLATKRFSEAEKGAIVADEFFATDWIDLSALSPTQGEFLNSLALSGLPHTDFRAFYHALVDRVIALNCAARTGSFALETGETSTAARRTVLAECCDLETRIAEERATLKKETQFNRQVEHNMRIKQMEKELAEKVMAL